MYQGYNLVLQRDTELFGPYYAQGIRIYRGQKES